MSSLTRTSPAEPLCGYSADSPCYVTQDASILDPVVLGLGLVLLLLAAALVALMRRP